MKKIKSILAVTISLVIMFACMPAVPVFAETYNGTCGENVTWALDTDTGVLTISGNGDMQNYTDSIDVPWCSQRNNIKSVNIVNGVTSIGNNAFEYCSRLTSITIPDSVTSIGDDAFIGCRSLESIDIPYGVTSIGKWAFSGCSSLESIFIPETVTEIGYEAFRSSQTDISVDENNPYFHCAGNCLIETETKTLIHGDGNSIIPDDGSVTTIGEAAFRDSDLETILIPNTITYIDHYAFSGTNLKQIVIPDSVTSMSGYCTFDNCRELESVHIGKGLESFTSLWRIFAHCDNLTSITVDKENQNFSSQGNCIINIKTKTLIAGCNNSTISNDSTIESIGYCAFEGCSKLRSITITDNIKTIDSYAFSECLSLQSIFIPKSTTSVGWGVFNSCSNLSEIKVDRDNPTYHSIDNCLIDTV